MMDKDKLVLDLENNEALAECFSRKEVGQTMSLTLDGKYKLEAKIDEIDPGKMAVLSLATEDVEPPKSEKAKLPKEPVDLVMAAEDADESKVAPV